jgi:hypothetical protein
MKKISISSLSSEDRKKAIECEKKSGHCRYCGRKNKISTYEDGYDTESGRKVYIMRSFCPKYNNFPFNNHHGEMYEDKIISTDSSAEEKEPDKEKDVYVETINRMSSIIKDGKMPIAVLLSEDQINNINKTFGNKVHAGSRNLKLASFYGEMEVLVIDKENFIISDPKKLKKLKEVLS